MTTLQNQLWMLQDTSYRLFQTRLIPNIAPSRIIGVRMLALRKMAREMIRDGKAETFMRELPHVYQEENLLHSILLSRMKDFDSLEQGLSCFLPWVDNWAVCDSLRPMLFYKKRNELIMRIPMWLDDAHPYTIRFGLEMLMLHYLEDYFRPEYLEWAAAVTCEDYYVKMMVAWFFATALASRYSLAVGYLEKHRLSMWIHNKTIQKALESYRIPAQYKDCLRALKWCN